MKISNNTEIILKKDRTIQITEKFNTLNTKVLLDFNNETFVKNESFFEKTKLYDDKMLFEFSLFSEDIKAKGKVKKALFTLNTIPSIEQVRDLSDVKMFTMSIKIYRFEFGTDNYQDPIVFTFTNKNSNLFDIINVFKHLNLYFKKFGRVVRFI